MSPEVAGQVGSALLGAGPVGLIAFIALWFARDTLRQQRADAAAALARETERADAERADAAAARADKDALQREIMDKVIPALAESSRVTRDFVEISRTRNG